MFRQITRFAVRRFIKQTSRKRRWYKFYSTLHNISLSGMNYNSGLYSESGELHLLKILKSKVKNYDKLLLFDIGANKGNYTSELYKIFGSEHVEIHAFEPSKYTFELLKQKTADYPNVTINNFGFSDSSGEIELFYDEPGSGKASVYERDLDRFDIEMRNSERIKVKMLDSYIDEKNIEEIFFLKIDVEGSEFKALKGAQKVIDKKKIRFIQFEFGEANIDSRTYLRDFYDLLRGYKFYRVLKDGIVELGDYREENEIFKTLNILAERVQ